MLLQLTLKIALNKPEATPPNKTVMVEIVRRVFTYFKKTAAFHFITTILIPKRKQTTIIIYKKLESWPNSRVDTVEG